MGSCAFRRARALALNVDWQGEQPAASTALDHDNGAPSSSAMLITPRGTHALMDIVEVHTSAKLQRALLDGQRERDRADRLQLEVDMLRARYAVQSTRASARDCHHSPLPNRRTHPAGCRRARIPSGLRCLVRSVARPECIEATDSARLAAMEQELATCVSALGHAAHEARSPEGGGVLCRAGIPLRSVLLSHSCTATAGLSRSPCCRDGCMVHVAHGMLHVAWRVAHRQTHRYHRVLARAEADAEETDHKVSELTEQVLRCLAG